MSILMKPKRGAIIFIPAKNRAVRHGGRFERRYFNEGRTRYDHPADVLAQMPGKSINAPAELVQTLCHVAAQVHRATRPAARQRRVLLLPPSSRADRRDSS